VPKNWGKEELAIEKYGRRKGPGKPTGERRRRGKIDRGGLCQKAEVLSF